ncbi:MAG TPA: hypothetical protein VK750_08390 [Cytophagaceae bacterium]|jgi:hypothetical protein|nr:hypothetical protein [Cytophagaceae bacterium]
MTPLESLRKSKVKVKLHTALFLIFFLIPFYPKAQTPEGIDSATTEVDTVIIKEEPVVFTKSLVIEHVKTVKVYLSGYASAFTTLNYYSPCAKCEDFLNQYQSSIASKMSYSYGLELTYAPRKISLGLAADYSVIKEKLDYTSPNGTEFIHTNSTRFLDIKATAGYWFRRNKRNVSFLLNGGLVYNLLLNAEGVLNSYTDTNHVVSITDAGKLNRNQFSATLGVKTILRPAQRIKVFVEPYYMGNILSITKDYYPYAQYYNRFGMRLGIIFSL